MFTLTLQSCVLEKRARVRPAEGGTCRSLGKVEAYLSVREIPREASPANGAILAGSDLQP